MYVETHSLSKRYGNFTALDDFTFGVERGEVVGLLGPNGAGKTTLLRMLLGFLRPSAGNATIDSLDCYRRSLEVRRRVAYLPGEARLFRTMRGRDVVEFFTAVRRDGSRQRAVALAAERFGLDLLRPVTAMSTGMRQKLALAVTLAVDTPLVILDEPTSNLDPTVRSDVAALVAEAKQAGRTVIFSSHVISEVEQVCDRAIILRQGRLVHTQILADLRRKHRIRAQLTGPLPGVPESFNGHVTVVTDRAGDLVIETPDELSGLLGWLATLPLAEVHIEPLGLRALYDQYHSI
ncbi:MAG: ATP-binding cassette domain-containing protein [Planctomycetia bacterium]|nr:ATP-binding cassette domain-containing protein [Planctomycetia bacterium]